MAGSAAAAALMHPLQALQEKLRRGRSQRQPSGRMFSYSRLSDAVCRWQVLPSQMLLQHLIDEGFMLQDSSAAASDHHMAGLQETGTKRSVALPPFVICPDAKWYRAFWFLTIAGAAWTGVIKSYTIAFEPQPGAQ
jgi:hypothetical protein